MICTRFISARPATLNLSQSQNANDTLAAAIDNHSFSLWGLGDSAHVGPNAAADELTRGVQQLGFVGALNNDYDREHFYHNTAYWPFFERAQEFDVPIYLHPAYPASDWTWRIQRNYAPAVAYSLGISGWDWRKDIQWKIRLSHTSAGMINFRSIEV